MAWRPGWVAALLRSEVGQRSEKDIGGLRLGSSVKEQKAVSGCAPPPLNMCTRGTQLCIQKPNLTPTSKTLCHFVYFVRKIKKLQELPLHIVCYTQTLLLWALSCDYREIVEYFFPVPSFSSSTVCDCIYIPLPPSFLSFSAIICSCASGYACDMLTILLLNSGSRIP